MKYCLKDLIVSTASREPPRTVRVTTEESEMDFFIGSRTTGKQLFDSVARLIGLNETWFFGLRFTDHRGQTAWLRLPEKITSQFVNVTGDLRFHFCVKYFPEDVTLELIQDITVRMFFFQVKRSIINADIECPHSKALLLASYDLQARYGDFDEDKVKIFVKDRLIPRDEDEARARRLRAISVVSKASCHSEYKLDAKDEVEIIEKWKERKGVSKEDAMMDYLEQAQDLPTYGVEYFQVVYETKYERVSEICVGIHASGIDLCASDDKAEERAMIEWQDIRKLACHKWKFVVKFVETDYPELIFRAESPEIHERMLALCTGYHEHHLRRRYPDAVLIQQMKLQAKDDRERRESDERELKKRKKKKNRTFSAEEAATRELESKVAEMIEARREVEKEVETERKLTEDLKRKSVELEEAWVSLLEERSKAERAKAEVEARKEEGEKERRRLEEEKEKAERDAQEEEERLEAKQEEVEMLRREVAEMTAQLETEMKNTRCAIKRAQDMGSQDLNTSAKN